MHLTVVTCFILIGITSFQAHKFFGEEDVQELTTVTKEKINWVIECEQGRPVRLKRDAFCIMVKTGGRKKPKLRKNVT